MPPLISVIIPVYNHAHTLKKCVASILAQTHRPLEIIIVNDGSTDNFAEVAKSLLPLPEGERRGGGSEKSPPYQGGEGVVAGVKVINQPNQGAPAARNRGFASSKGEYVIFWDADTLASPQMLQKMFAHLQKHPEASYAYSQFKFGWKTIKSQPFDADKLTQVNYIDITSLIRRSALLDSPLVPIPENRGSRSLREATVGRGGLANDTTSPPYQGGVGVVAEGLPAEFNGATEPNGGAVGREAGPFDPSLKRFQDWDLWLTLLESGKTGVFIPEVLYEKVVGSREGISTWLPSFFYQLPWKTKEVKKYEAAKEIVLRKHKLV